MTKLFVRLEKNSETCDYIPIFYEGISNKCPEEIDTILNCCRFSIVKIIVRGDNYVKIVKIYRKRGTYSV